MQLLMPCLGNQHSTLTRILTDWKSQLLTQYAKDTFASDLIDDKIQDDKYIVFNGIVYNEGRLNLVTNSKLKAKILRSLLNAPLVGHPWIFKTYH